ncbi:MAG: protein kinase [Planctomycetales bacterium]|nr:protein kinase [Planctomycetales bacterium]
MRLSERFLQRVEDQRLLRAEQLEIARRELLASTTDEAVAACAAEWVRQGWLTKFQASSLLQADFVRLRYGTYLVLEPLGRGGMGQVWKARHETLDREVVLKAIRDDRLENPSFRQRFQVEARAAARLDHENIVATYDAGESGGVPYIAMKFVDGEDLESLVRRRGPLPAAVMVSLGLQAVAGLLHAHHQGVIHRDVKPSNLLVDRAGRLRITDFGLARVDLPTDSERLTTLGVGPMGSPDFLSPEQARDPATADYRTDIYALGCTFHWLLTGSPLFPRSSFVERLAAHQHEPPPRLQSTDGVSSRLAELIVAMVAKHPEDRPELETVRQVLQSESMGEASDLQTDASPADVEALAKWLSRFDRESDRIAEVDRLSDQLQPLVETYATRLPTVDRPAVQRRNQAKSGLVGWVMGAGVAGMIVVASLVVMFGQADSKRPNDKLPPSTSPVAAKLPEGLRRAMRFSDHGGRNHTFVDVPSLHLQNWPEFTIEAWVTPHSPRYLSVLMSQTHSSGGVALRIDDQERWTAIIHDSQWNSDAVSEPLPVRSGRRQHVALAVDVREAVVFVDGQPGARLKLRGPLYIHQDAVFRIGAAGKLPTQPENFFVGDIDQVRVSSGAKYTSPFHPASVLAAESDTLALYDFQQAPRDANEHGVTVLLDAAPGKRHGQALWATWTTVSTRR